MGMYNEVYVNCPLCGTKCGVQIEQIVLGFGNFYLNDSQTTNNLTKGQKKLLKDYVEKEEFFCSTHGSFYIEVVIEEKPKLSSYKI